MRELSLIVGPPFAIGSVVSVAWYFYAQWAEFYPRRKMRWLMLSLDYLIVFIWSWNVYVLLFNLL